MDQERELLPLRDSQQAAAVGRCGRCGREIYARGGVCVYCERFGP